MEETPWTAPAQEMYVVSGQTSERLDVRALRDRIRSGQLTPDNEISVVGTDVWKPASQYPVLTRYFSLVAQKASSSASPMVYPSYAAAAPAAASRYAAGFKYPFTSITAMLFMLFGFVTALNPLLSIPVSLLASVFALAIIRTSGDGQTTAPEANAVGGIGDWILDLLRIIAVSVISAWPVIAAFFLFAVVRSIAVFFVALVVMLLYYPACLIAIARWKRLSMALSIKTIFGLISALGGEYYAAIVMFIALTLASAFATTFVGLTIGLRLARGVQAVIALFTTFYAAHLLGWAVYRHRDQLE
ncbi:MAG TPA: hypothetical protein VLU46_05070 [Thermoanaerobaculia bacterium]|nr:hypothetical protein [Thermoanaerobaculia bacterium]